MRPIKPILAKLFGKCKSGTCLGPVPGLHLTVFHSRQDMENANPEHVRVLFQQFAFPEKIWNITQPE
jgi:hypothetical protein